MASVLISHDGDLGGADSTLQLDIVLSGEVNSGVSVEASSGVIFIRRVGYDREPDMLDMPQKRLRGL